MRTDIEPSDHRNMLANARELRKAYPDAPFTPVAVDELIVALEAAEAKLAKVREIAEDPGNLDAHWGTLIDPGLIVEALDSAAAPVSLEAVKAEAWAEGRQGALLDARTQDYPLFGDRPNPYAVTEGENRG